MEPRVPTFEEVIPRHSLRDYQKKAVTNVLRELHNSDRVLLHAPTGSGKTRMAMSAVSLHMRERGPTMVLWLAPTAELVEQAAEAFSEAWGSHGDIGAVVFQWRGTGESYSHGMTIARNTMLVAGLKMAVQSVESDPDVLQTLQGKASLVVFDEAHQSVAPTYRALVENIMSDGPEKGLLLGLSATPGRASPEESKALAEMYGERKVGISPGENPIRFLVSNGYLAKANFRYHEIEGTPSPRPEGGGQDYSEDTLKELGDDDVRNRTIADMVNQLFAEGHKRVIAFTPSVESARRCAQETRGAGYKYAHAVHGGMSPASREHVLNTFRLPTSKIVQPQVVFNCRVLTAGVDIPQTSAVVIGKPTKSLVLLQQMIGRALRGPKSGGNAEAEIYMLVDESYEEYASLAAMFSQWDSLWDPDPI